MSASHQDAAAARLRLRLGAAEPRDGRGNSSTLAPGAELSTEDSLERLMRRIRRPRAEPEALPPIPTVRETTELAGRDLIESLGRGVGRSITPAGLEWLLRRQATSRMAPAAAPPVPPSSPGPDPCGPASSQSPAVPLRHPASSAQTHPSAVDGGRFDLAGPATRAQDELHCGEARPWAGPATGPVQPMLADSATSEPGGASSTERHSLEPVWPDRASQKPAKKRRKRSTIAVDPLDAPLDPRHARVAAGGLIHDLEVEKIERPR
jgi:hypothetical protein